MTAHRVLKSLMVLIAGNESWLTSIACPPLLAGITS